MKTQKSFGAIIFSVATFVVATLVVAGLSSCAKKDINGQLDGIWEVKEIKIGGNEPVVPAERRFFRFQLHVVQLSGYDMVFTSGNLDYDGSVVRMDFPFMESEPDSEELRTWGIYQNPVAFKVESLNDKFLDMTAGDVTLHLRKF